MLYKLFSYISNIINLLGLNFAICLHNSEPIEPPPPVTNMDFPLISSPIFSLAKVIGSLPNKSSISTSLKFCNKLLFLIISATLGSTLIFTPVS